MSWATRIAKAKKREKFTGADKIDATCWHTCAVGEVRKLFPDAVVVRIENTQPRFRSPIDPVLSRLGTDFGSAVADDQPDVAQALLALIQDRAKALDQIKRYNAQFAASYGGDDDEG